MRGAHWLDTWWRLVGSVVGGIFALVGPYLGALSDNTVLQGVGLVVGIIGLLIASILPIVEKNNSNREIAALKKDLVDAKEEARADFLFVTNFSLTPLVQKLSKVVLARKGSRDLEAQAAELRTQALGVAREVIGGEHRRVRANYFKLEYLPADRSRLVQAGSTATPPRDYFDFDTDEGEEVLNMLAQNGSRFCPSVVDDPPPGWDMTKQRDYETFISVTSTTFPGQEPDGMMTVDGSQRGDLTEADISMLRLIATIVALSESQRNGS